MIFRMIPTSRRSLFERLPQQMLFFNDLYKTIEKFEGNRFCCRPTGEVDCSVVFTMFGFLDKLVARKLLPRATIFCWLFGFRDICSISDLFRVYYIFGVDCPYPTEFRGRLPQFARTHRNDQYSVGDRILNKEQEFSTMMT